jgi:hypothetical protein
MEAIKEKIWRIKDFSWLLAGFAAADAFSLAFYQLPVWGGFWRCF